MIPVEFPEQNKIYGKPKDMTDEECSSLSVWQGKTSAGRDAIISKWMPNVDDIAAINRGEGIFIEIMCPVMIPISVYTENPFTQE